MPAFRIVPPVTDAERRRAVLRAWWYVKRRKNPTGVMGRPRSPIPLKERRRLARLKHAVGLKERDLRQVRLAMPAEMTKRLHELARTRGLSPGALVAELLATCPSESPCPGS